MELGISAISRLQPVRLTSTADAIPAMPVSEALTRSADASGPSRNVLIMVGAYLPGYKAGGPIRSVSNLVAALGDEFRFRVVTLDRDLGESIPYSGIQANSWLKVGSTDVIYTSAGWRGLYRAVATLCKIDSSTVLYLNSLFARRFSIVPMFMRYLGLIRPERIILAPRGELSTGALNLKRFRKRAYLNVTEWLGLYRDVIWHASSEQEAADIRARFSKVPDIRVAKMLPETTIRAERSRSVVAIAEDIAQIEIKNATQSQRKRRGTLRIVFLSRIARMKNLASALEMLSGLSGQVSFDIFGPDEDKKYWSECQAIIASLPQNIQVRYRGEVRHDEVVQTLSGYDLLLLPTLGENYGHVIAEALHAGCPVLISDRTPWRNLEQEGVGWDISLDDVQRFREVLQHCVNADEETYRPIRLAAQSYAVRRFQDTEVIESNRQLFQYAASSRRRFADQ